MSGTIDGSATVPFVNTYDGKPGDLTISKTVVDAPEADAGKEFSFTLNMVLHDDEIDVGTLTGLINTFLTQEGRQLISDDEKERICSELIQALLGPDPVTEFAFSTTFTLKDGETATLKNLGYATTYKITEAGVDGYIPSSGTAAGAIGESLTVSGTIDGNVTVPFVNTNGKLNNLTLKKTVVGAPADDETEFAFDVKMTIKNPAGLNVSYVTNLTDIFNATGVEASEREAIVGELNTAILNGSPTEFTFAATLHLKDGESVAFNKLGYGSSYEITEAGNEGYIARSGDQTGELGGALTVSETLKGEAATVEFVNTCYQAITITSSTKSWMYDGITHMDEVYEVYYGSTLVEADSTGKKFTLPTGDTITITSTAAGVKDYDESYDKNNTFTYELTNASLYKSVSTAFGTLSIDKRVVLLTSETAEKPYDGTPLTRPTVTVSAAGFVEGEVTDIKATGSVTTVDEGEVTNTIVYTEGANFKADNYTITKNEGTLKITPITAEYEITVTGNSDTKVYNGAEQSVSGYTVSEYDSTITFNGIGQTDAKATAAGTNVGTYTMPMTAADFTATSPNYTNIKITVVPGTLTITPITAEYEITVTGNSDTKVYNGAEQSVSGYTVSEYDSTITFNGIGQTDAKATAAGTNVGTYTMPMTAADFTATSPNYTNIKITVVPGTLTITPIGPVTIASATRSWTYDGTTHTEEVYTVTYDGTTVKADATGKVFTLPTGDRLTITATADGVKDYGAGYSRNNTFTYTLAHADHYTNVSVTYGTLRINKRQVTLTSGSSTKMFDGAALRNTKVTATGDGWVKGEGATYDAFPSITNVGTVANTFTYQLNAGTKADNYEITVVNGRLRVFVEEIPDEEVPLAFPGYLGNQTGECFE